MASFDGGQVSRRDEYHRLPLRHLLGGGQQPLLPRETRQEPAHDGARHQARQHQEKGHQRAAPRLRTPNHRGAGRAGFRSNHTSVSGFLP